MGDYETRIATRNWRGQPEGRSEKGLSGGLAISFIKEESQSVEGNLQVKRIVLPGEVLVARCRVV